MSPKDSIDVCESFGFAGRSWLGAADETPDDDDSASTLGLSDSGSAAIETESEGSASNSGRQLGSLA